MSPAISDFNKFMRLITLQRHLASTEGTLGTTDLYCNVLDVAPTNYNTFVRLPLKPQLLLINL